MLVSKRLFAAVALLLTAAMSFYTGRQMPTMTEKLDNPRITVTGAPFLAKEKILHTFARLFSIAAHWPAMPASCRR